jgi:hypothetical protein
MVSFLHKWSADIAHTHHGFDIQINHIQGIFKRNFITRSEFSISGIIHEISDSTLGFSQFFGKFDNLIMN